VDYTYEQIAKMIDHSLLNPAMTTEDLERELQIALDYDVASVCIMPYYLKRCTEALAGSTVKGSTTIGLPHGGHTTVAKVTEAERALADGGEKLDMAVNISKVLSSDWEYVREDIQAVLDATHAHVQIKAAGGVRTLNRLLEVRGLGVTQAGASRTTTILDECKRRLGM
jgi:deoxyribose-phosphate aldolase